MAESARRPVRVLIAKPGLDGHDRGAKVLVRALRDAGMEVVYTGRRQTPAQIARAAVQEDARVVGLSCLSGAHGVLFPEVVAELRRSGAADVVVIGGGIIPERDVPPLREAGVEAVFGPGTSTQAVVEWIDRRLGAGAGGSHG